MGEQAREGGGDDCKGCVHCERWDEFLLVSAWNTYNRNLHNDLINPVI